MQETAEMVAWIKAGDQRAVIFYGKSLLIAQDGVVVYLIFAEADPGYFDHLPFSCIPTVPGA
ncbi:hypothetical protein ASPSYDRAFT_134617 [Aspergillus sydowii CBS 593.65]|uniref:Uncharacterized protein n=1 Tax=Aspergillus sydowii CBS 593.65 TaxID=1036612 RepID=A0A1L9T8V5_9EURO|nr:uncharacterized protein ASPSYDRAFT_134617 [Aspergillus sydowii CBS 593.65]OJJ55821.1 hypothetical protein ASPSYDRAFT_134617 [Aspergillus sydowii CBS 593.65]